MGALVFSDRQRRVAEFVAAGYSNRDIAKELKLTEQIVKNVVHSLFDKVGVWNRVELANYFAQSESPEEREAARTLIEAERLAQVHRRKILDTTAERVFDEITSLAANIFDVPIAIVVLVDSKRVWFKSKIGLGVSEVPREITLCHQTIQQSKVFVVQDALQDSRFMCSPLVTSEPNLRFYAAAPLLTDEGYALGVVCIVDRVPRQLAESELKVLESLARIAMEQLELRAQLEDLKCPHEEELESGKTLAAESSI